jgi:hypothetical protein
MDNSSSYSKRSQDLYKLLKLLLFIIIMTSLLGCESLQQILDEECTFRNEQYQQILAVEGSLHEEIPDQAPYPMALIISQNSINRILQDVSDTALSPIEFGIVKVLPQLPIVKIESIDQCDTCIVVDLSFDIEIDAILDTLQAKGTARYQFPIRMQRNEQDTQVFAEFDQSKFQRLGFSTGQAFVDEALSLVEEQIKSYVNDQLQDYLGAVELFSIEAWQLGEGAIRILAAGPIMSPENKTLVIGLHTNLVQPLSQSVALEPSLPKGVDIGLQMHPELLQVILQRMLHEGVISRSYNESGERISGERVSGERVNTKEDIDAFDLTLSSIKSSSKQSQALDLGFTLWRTKGILCGSVEVHTDLNLSIGEQGLAVSADQIRLQNAQGSFGLVASQVETWIKSDFMNEIIDLSALTLNYNELSVSSQSVVKLEASEFNFNLNGHGINLYFNLGGLSEGF